MPEPVLTLRRLNRALLARQFLLDRAEMNAEVAVEELVALQAQLSSAPYVGLWSRVKGFTRRDLFSLIIDRRIVKATYVRGTLHLLSAKDYIRTRSTIQPLLSAGWAAITKNRSCKFDFNRILASASDYIAENPRTFAEISDYVTTLEPGQDVGPMRYAVRMHLPLVQVPTDTPWGYPSNPRFALSEQWIGRILDDSEYLGELVLRYLGAFGPASVTDSQTWLGAPNLKTVFEGLRPQLQVYRDENRRELFDVAGAILPSEESAAPIRFLPEFDNTLLGHSNRRRIIADEHRKAVYLPGLRVAATILVNGFVAGTWKVEQKRQTATLTIEPFGNLTPADRKGVQDEGEDLVRFIAPEASAYEIRVVS